MRFSNEMRITEKYRKAPDGFTLQQWELFN